MTDTPQAPTRVAHLVLTGGPGAGKSTALSYLTEQLTHRGWRVLTVPEAATLLITGGVNDIGVLAAGDRPAYLGVQRQLVGLQRTLRDTYQDLAESLAAAKTVVLHDRGVADNAAYMDPAEYESVLATAGLDVAAAHALYDGVIHLRSAAIAAPGYDGSAYTTANNAARSEDPAAAAALDEATLRGWAEHPHLLVVPSTGSFPDKLARTLSSVLRMLGDPDPVEVERKFVLNGAPDLTHPVLAGAHVVDIEQIYLPQTDAGEQRVRARTLGGVTTYTHAVKTDVGDGSRIEVESPINEQTYRLLGSLRDPATRVVRKRRHVFIHADQRFELDEILAPVKTWLLEAELVDFDDPLLLPDFLPIGREVTHDRTWRNRSLAAAS